MLILSKLKSKKGYIFTFEAIVAVIIILMVFYVGYFTITHNILTFHEEKRDIEAFEKSNLIVDKIFKDHEFPSNSYNFSDPCYPMFINNVKEKYYTLGDTIPGTFDPYSPKSTGYEYNIIHNLTIYSNVINTSINSTSYNFNNNRYVKTKKLLVPVKTWYYPNITEITENISMGEVLYFSTRRPAKLRYINISAPQPVNVTLSVNGVPFKMYVNSTPKISEFGKVINIHHWNNLNPNEIKILNISKDVPVTLGIAYNTINIRVLKLRPENISCIITLKD